MIFYTPEKLKKILIVDSSKALVRIFWSSRRHMGLSELYEGSKCQNFTFYVYTVYTHFNDKNDCHITLHWHRI